MAKALEKNSLEKKIKKCIRRGLRDGHAELETLPSGRVSGFVVSSEFDGLDYDQRRLLLGALFDQELTPAERHNVGVLLTYSPAEWNVKLEGI